MTLGITISLLIVSLLLFILILSLFARHFAERDIRILSQVAGKYEGKISVDSFNSSATMNFPHRGAEVKFYQRKGLGGKTNRCCLRCDLDFSTALSMHIAKGISKDTSIAELRYLMCMPRISVGSERFNKEFVVRGNNQSFLSALLAAKFEKQLLSFSSNDPVIYLHPKNGAVTRIKGGTLRIHLLEFSVDQAPRQREDLERLIDDGLAVIQRFFGANVAT